MHTLCLYDASNVTSRSAIISQLIYSAGASGFAGANGSMMIEVVVSVVSSAVLTRSCLHPPH